MKYLGSLKNAIGYDKCTFQGLIITMVCQFISLDTGQKLFFYSVAKANAKFLMLYHANGVNDSLDQC